MSKPALCRYALIAGLGLLLALGAWASARGGNLGQVDVAVFPAQVAVSAGQEFALEIRVAAGDHPVNAMDLHLAFDVAFLQVARPADPGPALKNVAGNRYDNVAGTLDFGAYRPGDHVSGDFLLCTLHFRALQPTAGTWLTTSVAYDPPILVVGPGEVIHTVRWTPGIIAIYPPGTLVPTVTPAVSPTPPPPPPVYLPLVQRQEPPVWVLALPLILRSREPQPPAVLARFGLCMTPNTRLGDYPLARLPFGWWLDWTYRLAPDPAQPPGVEYVAVLPVDQRYPPNWDHLRAAVLANPGALWIIGNEPECIYQGNRTPEEYAEIYHAYATFLRDLDPTCRLAIGGVVQPTPLRLRWLDLVLQSYLQRYGAPIPVDVWNIHNQILQEKRHQYGCGIPAGLPDDEGMLYPWWENDNLDHFRQQIIAFRRWMAERGLREKPLYVSEFGILYPSAWFDALGLPGGDARVIAFMQGAFDFLLTATDPALGDPNDGNRLVQRWAWFSLNNPTWEQSQEWGFNGNLCDPRTRQLTVFGEFYETYMRRLLGGP